MLLVMLVWVEVHVDPLFTIYVGAKVYVDVHFDTLFIVF